MSINGFRHCVAVCSILFLITPLFAQQGSPPQPSSQAQAEHAADEGQQLEFRLRVLELETQAQMHALNVELAKLAVDEARGEVKKAEIRLDAARKQPGDSEQIAVRSVELQQTQIRVKMLQLQARMADLENDLIRSQIRIAKRSWGESHDEPTRVQLEYDDNLDIIVIRGSRDNVNKVKALIDRVRDR